MNGRLIRALRALSNYAGILRS